jgi:hypothetical protein
VDKLKLNEILQLDCRKQENMDILNAALGKMPFKVVGIGDLEKAVHKMSRKYPIVLSYIMPGPIEDNFYTFMIKNREDNNWLKTVYSNSLYEGMAKVALFMYSFIKNNYSGDGE